MLNTRQLHHFLAIVDHGSLGRAAKALHISEPALSKSIRILEDSLQVKLFDRGPRGLELTTLGHSLLDHSRVVVAELRRAVLELRELQGNEVGHVYIGSGPSFVNSILPQAVARLLESNPGLRISLLEAYSDVLVPKVLHGEIDFAILTLDVSSPDPDLVQERLFQDDALIVARRDHPLAKKEHVSLTDLQSAQWILAKRPDLLRLRVEETFEAAELHPPRPVIECTSVNFQRAMMQTADMVSFVPRNLVSAELERGDLVQLTDGEGTWRRSVGLIYRRRGSQSPACRALLKEIRTLFGEPAG